MVKPKHSARQRRRAFALANGDVSSHIAVGITRKAIRISGNTRLPGGQNRTNHVLPKPDISCVADTGLMQLVSFPRREYIITAFRI